MKKLQKTFMACLLAFAVLCGGCSPKVEEGPQAAMAEATERITAEEPDPMQAAEDVYAQMPDLEYRQITDEEFEELLRIPLEEVEEVYAFVTNPKKGLANLIIVLPKTQSRDLVREELYQYRDACVEQYRNYDILDSYSIAQEAEVFDQGEYLILLMTPDNDAARERIDQWMPI